MNRKISCPCNDKYYRHGIILRYCIVKKYEDSDVSTVQIGTLVEVVNIQKETIIFSIANRNFKDIDDLFVCKTGDILFIPENLWGPLLAVDIKQRLSIVQNQELVEALRNIAVGSTVKILTPGFKKTCIGSVKFLSYIGKLGMGMYFGIKITYPIKDLQFIKENFSLIGPETKGFPGDCDIVVTLDRIHPIDTRKTRENIAKIAVKEDIQRNTSENNTNKKIEASSIINSKSFLVCNANLKQKSSHENLFYSKVYNLRKGKKVYNLPLSTGEQVVYIHNDTFEKGTVRWIGFVENSLKIGIEFENPIGYGTGIFYDIELFKTKNLHAGLMPPETLIKLSDFEMSNSKDCGNQHKTTNNNNCDSLKSNVQCCSANQNLEEKNNMLKINPYQNSKLINTIHGENFHLKGCNEDYNSRALECRNMCKEECRICFTQLHYPSRSFDFVRSTNERKISNNRHSRSMDNNLTQNEELFANVQNSISMQKSGKYLQDFFSCNLSESYGLRPKTLDNDFDCCISGLNSVTVSDDANFPHSFRKKNVSNNDVAIWETPNSEHSSSDESGDYYDTPKSLVGNISSQKLGKGSVVELIYKGQPYYGVIRWTGVVPDDEEGSASRLIAGVEMEVEMNGFTDGTYRNKRYFQCNPRKALFIPLSECRKDSRFIEENNRHNTCLKINSFGQVDCPIVVGTVPPICFRGNLESICGKNRGIQGHHNSCYLDATLFAMFAFTSVFDSLLYRPPTVNDIPQYSEVQRVLKEEIVNPLRKNLYVRADRVMKLRTLLENLSSVSGLTCDEKDPEEFLNSLLAQILRAEPFLKLSSGQETFHYQLFVEKDERLVFPSVQQLFEQSFVTSDIKLKQIPSCLIIQMPRFGKSFKMYSRIFPSQLLDVTDIIENSPRQCTVCGKLAQYECKDCFGQNGIGSGLESISYCKTCLEKAHSHHIRIRHNNRSITVPFEFFDLQDHCSIPRINMELYAVVCIETSHYVAFVKCGTGSDAPWCFFDSMADRKGEQNGYNIPEMVACPDLPYWLSEEGMKTLNEVKDERQLPEHAKRLLCDAYMCMYQSPDIMMYR